MSSEKQQFQTVPFKTIDEVIEAFKRFPEGTQLKYKVNLQKMKVNFHMSQRCINQDHEIVEWTSKDFNNLDLSIDYSPGTITKYSSGDLTDTGSLVAELEKFRKEHPEKTYAVTYGGKLLKEPIVEMVPKIMVSDTHWSSTTLSDAFRERQKFTGAIDTFLRNVTEPDQNKLFAVVQQVIQVMPNRPSDYFIYCVRKSPTEWSVFTTRQEAETHWQSRGKDLIASDQTSFKIKMSTVDIFKQVQPNIYILDTQIYDQIAAKINEVQELVKQIAI